MNKVVIYFIGLLVGSIGTGTTIILTMHDLDLSPLAGFVMIASGLVLIEIDQRMSEKP